MKRLRLFALPLMLATPIGCSGEPPDDGAEIGAVEQNAIFNPQSPILDTMTVCWENATASNLTYRNNVRKIIEAEYHERTRVRFTEWKDGSCNDSNIRITVYSAPSGSDEARSHTAWDSIALGVFPMSLNMSASGSYTPIHEFGHALGLGHEQARVHSPCTKERDTYGATIPIGPYDDESIMNYCESRSDLSDGDVAALNRLHGWPGRYFIEDDGTKYRHVTRHAAGVESTETCRIVSERQLVAFGVTGAGRVPLEGVSSIWEAGVNVGTIADCAWPAGMYRRQGEATVHLLRDPATPKCLVENSTQLETFGGEGQVMLVDADTDLSVGRPGADHGQLCLWADGLYQEAGSPAKVMLLTERDSLAGPNTFVFAGIPELPARYSQTRLVQETFPVGSVTLSLDMNPNLGGDVRIVVRHGATEAVVKEVGVELPQQTLTADLPSFVGVSSEGDWTLEVTDKALGRVYTLARYQLSILPPNPHRLACTLVDSDQDHAYGITEKPVPSGSGILRGRTDVGPCAYPRGLTNVAGTVYWFGDVNYTYDRFSFCGYRTPQELAVFQGLRPKETVRDVTGPDPFIRRGADYQGDCGYPSAIYDVGAGPQFVVGAGAFCQIQSPAQLDALLGSPVTAKPIVQVEDVWDLIQGLTNKGACAWPNGRYFAADRYWYLSNNTQYCTFDTNLPSSLPAGSPWVAVAAGSDLTAGRADMGACPGAAQPALPDAQVCLPGVCGEVRDANGFRHLCQTSEPERPYVSRLVTSGEHLWTRDAAERNRLSTSGGFTLELLGAFYVRPRADVNTRPLFRCQLFAGKHLYTTDPSCEGAGRVDGEIGQIATWPQPSPTNPADNAVPLYRMAHPNGDRLITTNFSEVWSALYSGWSYEGILGYVWTTVGPYAACYRGGY